VKAAPHPTRFEMSLTTTIRHTLNKADNVLVVTHVDPDGDALGSLTAMGSALKQQGKLVTLACDDNVPARFAFLPLADEIQQKPARAAAYDLLIALDCGDDLRMGRVFSTLSGPLPTILNIDHHVTNTRFGDVNLVDPTATSTAEMLYQLFVALGYPITPAMALSLLTGLVTDTLGFRTAGVTAATLRIAGELVEAGADLAHVTLHALNLRTLSTIQLWRTGLNNMHLEDGLIWTTITQQERAAVGFRSNSSVGLVNLIADVEEAAMGAVIMEMADGSVRVGFRCRSPYNVADVAVQLGGGGHPLAAGCALDGPLPEAEALVVRLCKEAILAQAT